MASSSDAGLSAGEKSANQAQIDQALASIDRIVATTNFNGKRLLDGSQAIAIEGTPDDLAYGLTKAVMDRRLLAGAPRFSALLKSHKGGFFQGNCGSGIRNSLNTLQYPDDLNGSVHHDGQICAGFNWDAMVLLQERYGRDPGTIISAERWHFGRALMAPAYQDDQVWATYVADDDNGEMCIGDVVEGFDEEIAEELPKDDQNQNEGEQKAGNRVGQGLRQDDCSEYDPFSRAHCCGGVEMRPIN